MENGFYKYENEQLLYASTYVKGPSIELLIEDKDTYTYPKDGWSYFETKQEALDFFGIEEDK